MGCGPTFLRAVDDHPWRAPWHLAIGNGYVDDLDCALGNAVVHSSANGGPDLAPGDHHGDIDDEPTMSAPLLCDHLSDWLERRRAHLRPTTHASYRQLIRAYLVPFLGEHRIVDLDRAGIERAYSDLLDHGGHRGRPLAPRTVRYCHAVLRRALEDAVVDGLIEANPARLARPPRHDPANDVVDDDLQVWTAEQVAVFLNHVDDHPLRALWHLSVGTGARRGELLGLRWRDVDLAAGQVRIRRALSVVDGTPRLLGTKTSRSRALRVPASTLDALVGHQRNQDRRRAATSPWHDRWGLVFTDGNGHPIDPMHVTRAFRQLVREAPVPVIRFHDLRHTHATLLLSAGVPIKVVSERLGHTTIAMTMDVYGHVLPAMDGDAADRLDAMLDGQRVD